MNPNFPDFKYTPECPKPKSQKTTGIMNPNLPVPPIYRNPIDFPEIKNTEVENCEVAAKDLCKEELKVLKSENDSKRSKLYRIIFE